LVDFAQDPRYLAFAESILGVRFDPRTVTYLTSLDQSGNILGVAVFSRFTTGNCELTVASSGLNWLSRGFIYRAAAYAFLQINCRRVTAIIAVENEKSLNLAQQFGFKMEGRLRDWFPSGDAFILGLMAEQCDWIKDSHGQPFRPRNT